MNLSRYLALWCLLIGAAHAQTQPGNNAKNGSLSAQECEARKRAVIATRIPDNASITASQETVMFMTQTIIDMIDGRCPTEPGVTPAQIAAERQLRRQQYLAAERACNAVQSGGRRCTARNHTSTQAANKPPISSPASNTRTP